MITLYQFEPALGLPNASPFCMKLETYLRMAQLPYQAPLVSMQDFGRAPKGKMPYIEDQGRVIADSSFIIDYLKQTYGDSLDSWMGAEQRAIALAFQRLFEDNLYWSILYGRWIDPKGWPLTRDAFFGKLPVPLKWVVPTIARRGIRQQLRGHGMGRHSQEDIALLAKNNVTAVATFLQGKQFMMGDQPCSLDATAYAFLANLLWAPLDSSIRTHAQQFAQLEAYCQRMRARYFQVP